MTWLLSVKPSTRKNKRFMATFCPCDIKNACGGKHHVVSHFGQPKAQTFIDGASDEKRRAHVARHAAQEDPTTPATLSKYLLWTKSNLKDAMANFKKKFSV